jgi:hypothetical protein
METRQIASTQPRAKPPKQRRSMTVF